MVNIKSEIEAVIEIFETIIKDKRIFIGINYEEEVFCNIIEENGTGLGLPIAGEAIRRNGGTLEVIENTVGACFRIILKKVEGN